jgi:hypothetical protein
MVIDCFHRFSSQERPTMELTAKMIDTVSLPEGKSALVVFDEIAGFGIRIRAGRQPNVLLSIPYEPVQPEFGWA